MAGRQGGKYPYLFVSVRGWLLQILSLGFYWVKLCSNSGKNLINQFLVLF